MPLTAFAKISAVRSLYANDRDYAELLALFADRLPAIRGRIETAWDAGDLPELGSLAHQLQAAAGNYGFPELATAAEKLQQLVKHDPGADVGTAYTVLLEQLRR
ncbi:MAG TPA: Hpt domain-containing protein, partial [Pirellulaceae bacterium]|nr:Hpt domain-containing protein [Pirellulaceae bacterium]